MDVLVIGPQREALSQLSAVCARSIIGALHEVASYPGPACRKIPKSPLVSYQLHKHVDNRKLPIVEAGQLPRVCVETWAGCSIISTELVRVGFICRAYECSPGGASSYLPEGDVEHPENQDPDNFPNNFI